MPTPQGQPAAISAELPPITTEQPKPAGAQAQADADDPGVTETAGGVLVKSEAFKRLKQKARERGQREALEQLAKDNGFGSVEEMQMALKSKKQNGKTQHKQGNDAQRRPDAGARASGGAIATDDGGQEGAAGASADVTQLQREMRRLARRLEAAEATNKVLSKKMQHETNARKKTRQERDAIEAEMIVREAAARVGIKDIDYALRLVTKELSGKPDEEVAKFDEAKFFDGLRGTHPYLFGETMKPVTTGNGAGAAPPTPTPGAAQQSAAQGGQADARKMDQKQYQEHLKARGLSINL